MDRRTGSAVVGPRMLSSLICAAVVLGFVAKDYLTNQITTNEAVIQSAIGLGAVGASVGVGVIVSAATGPAHQSWTPMTILSDPLGRLERFGADVAE